MQEGGVVVLEGGWGSYTVEKEKRVSQSNPNKHLVQNLHLSLNSDFKMLYKWNLQQLIGVYWTEIIQTVYPSVFVRVNQNLQGTNSL